jgi:hypothetical protein
MRKNLNTLRSWRLPVATVAAALALAGCAKGSGEAAATPSPSPTTASAEPMFEFNDLGGGSDIIEVYPGPGDTAAERRSDGTAYRDGEVRPVVCYQEGRWVESHPDPDVGEEYRRSNIWYQLGGTATPYYATAVYGDIVPAGATVRPC